MKTFCTVGWQSDGLKTRLCALAISQSIHRWTDVSCRPTELSNFWMNLVCRCFVTFYISALEILLLTYWSVSEDWRLRDPSSLLFLADQLLASIHTVVCLSVRLWRCARYTAKMSEQVNRKWPKEHDFTGVDLLTPTPSPQTSHLLNENEHVSTEDLWFQHTIEPSNGSKSVRSVRFARQGGYRIKVRWQS